MGHIDVNSVSFVLPDGRPLLDEVSFRVGEGAKVALIGPNGTGQDHAAADHRRRPRRPTDGAVTRVGRARRDAPVRGLGPRRLHGARPAACRSRPPAIRAAAAEIDRSRAGHDGARRARPTRWPTPRRSSTGATSAATTTRRSGTCCTVAALGMPFEQAQWRKVTHPVGRRAEAGGARGAAARARGGAAARRAGQLPRRAGQALARGPADRLAQDGAVRQPRPRAARPGRRPGSPRSSRAARGRAAWVHPAAASRPTSRPARTGTPGSRSCAGAGTRSTSSSRRWS